MIDFRYHLASLFAVLVALAIGIVLGAGPLKEGIGDSLNKQVASLRQEKADLRAELDTANSQASTHASFEQSQLRSMVNGRLNGISVLVLTLPGASADLVTTSEDTLIAAGATLTGRVSLAGAYAEPATSSTADSRESLAGELAGGLAVSRDTAPGTLLDAVVATLLAVRSDSTTTPPNGETRSTAWRRLSEAGLVGGDLPPTLAQAVLVIGGPAAEASPDTVGAADVLARFAGVLDGRCDGVVIAADLDPTAKQTTHPIAATRSTATLRQHVSTVDDGPSTMGQVSVVLALAEQVGGKVGQYGFASGASRAFPQAG